MQWARSSAGRQRCAGGGRLRLRVSDVQCQGYAACRRVVRPVDQRGRLSGGGQRGRRERRPDGAVGAVLDKTRRGRPGRGAVGCDAVPLEVGADVAPSLGWCGSSRKMEHKGVEVNGDYFEDPMLGGHAAKPVCECAPGPADLVLAVTISRIDLLLTVGHGATDPDSAAWPALRCGPSGRPRPGRRPGGRACGTRLRAAGAPRAAGRAHGGPDRAARNRSGHTVRSPAQVIIRMRMSQAEAAGASNARWNARWSS